MIEMTDLTRQPTDLAEGDVVEMTDLTSAGRTTTVYMEMVYGICAIAVTGSGDGYAFVQRADGWWASTDNEMVLRTA